MNPFQKLRKAALETECLSRNIWYEGAKHKDALDAFADHMAGLARVPALCYGSEAFDFTLPATDWYEVAAVEPLHDLKEHIKNLWEELPHILLPGKSL